ncbi:MAG: hypothetical protein JSR09_11155 [Bacteroidetes bacterium]|nr:hypothetical protein [Bacteroidota bacterium]MBS1650249.1 hypothetical protein [Bacteroidota bacterium]
MKHQTLIRIAEPCHENWNNMNEVEKGRFCLSCQKKVIDFSNMTDAEVLNFLNYNKGRICGRFELGQTMRPLVETKINEKRNWKWALAAITAMIFSINKNNAQTNTKLTETTMQFPVSSNNELMQRSENKSDDSFVKDTTQPALKNNIKGFDPTAKPAIMGLIIPEKVEVKKASWIETFALTTQKIFSYVGTKTKSAEVINKKDTVL